MKTLILTIGLLLVPFVTLAQSEGLTSPDPLAAAAAENRSIIRPENDGFSGDGWSRLIAEGSAAQFFLIGEEHGIAENPQLAAALFSELTHAGYSRLAIEVSPFMAALMDDALADDDMAGLSALFAKPGGQPAFFGMAEEAEMLSSIRAELPDANNVLWGTDYEVLGDRQMLQALEAMDNKPDAATAALVALRADSDAGWAKYEETRGPQFVFSFAGDPQLVRDVELAWPSRSEEAAWILDQIEETLEINLLFLSGNNYASNKRRAEWLRENFLRHWRTAKASGETPRVMAKFGASHMVRGRNSNGVFDLGTTLPELAALEQRETVSLMVLPGHGSTVAVLDPTAMTYRQGPAKDGYTQGMNLFYEAAYEDGYTLFDLRKLRPIMPKTKNLDHDALARTIHGFDYLLIMTGSTASSALPN
jgi:hypothetical protein